MFSDAIDAFNQIFTPPFRKVLVRSLALTLAVLALVWLGLDRLATSYVTTPWPWLDMLIAIAAALGLLVGLVFLVAPVSALVAGFYLDELAETVERSIAPERVGQALPGGQAMWLAVKFAAVSVLVNLLALALLLLPGINILAFFGANAYLLGREYFELAALRYRPLGEVRAMRSAHGLYLFVCGLFIAAMVAIPVLNLLTPLFATAFMVRIHKRLAPLPQVARRDEAAQAVL
jgi:CysZ protein